MKKIYTLLLAAAVGAFAASAAMPKAETIARKLDMPKMGASVTAVYGKAVDTKAPIAKAAAAVSSLDNQSYAAKFTLLEKDDNNQVQKYGFMTRVKFTDEDLYEGVLWYYMSNFMTGIYNEQVGVPALEVAYDPSQGLLVVPAEQTFLTVPLESGGTAELQMWLADKQTCVQVPAQFLYNDGKFELKKNLKIQFQGESAPTDFVVEEILIGMEGQNGIIPFVELTSDFSFAPSNGVMNYTMTTSASGTPQAVKRQSPINAELSSNTLTITGFATLGDVPMAIDATAKTLTADNVSMGNYNAGSSTAPVMVECKLSASNANGDNLAGAGSYKLVSTYAVADGKTTITVPDWNMFFTYGGQELSYLWPMSATTIDLEFDLDAAVAGVKDIISGEALDTNAPVEYYNLQGVRVAEPAAGLYIKRQGKNVTKVVIR